MSGHQPNLVDPHAAQPSIGSSDIWSEGAFTEPGWHRRARSEAAYYPEHLIVFVHGVRSHWKKAWGNLPAYILRRLDVDCDLYSYSYPSNNFESADYKKAGAQLYQKLITPEFQNYRHISFIVHSTGGLVVKRALLQNQSELEHMMKSGEIDVLDRRHLMFRTRRIINFGVPHRGGSLKGWLLFTFLSPLLFPIWTVLHLKNKIVGLFETTKGYPLGYNWIAPQLTWWWQDLANLEESFADFIRKLDKRGLPRPVSSDFIGSNDQAVGRQYGDVKFAPEQNVGVRDDAKAVIVRETHSRSVNEGGTHPESIVVRGTHSNAKEPDGPFDFKMDVIVGELRSLMDDGALSLVARGESNGDPLIDPLVTRIAATTLDRTLVHVSRIEKTFDIVSLIDGDSPGHGRDERRSVSDSWLGSQAQVMDHVLGLCAERRSGLYVVTGLAGVGKSSVLRRLATTLCTQHLANKSSTGIPLYMPLFRYGADIDTQKILRQEGLHWDSFARWWCEFANDENKHASRSDRHQWSEPKVQQIPIITPGWLEILLKQRSVVIILDGVDDFLVRNAYLGYDSLNTLILELRSLTKNSGCEIVLGIRSSLALPEYLRQGGVAEVARLSPEQAKTLVYSLRDQAMPWERLVTRVVRRMCRHYVNGSSDERQQISARMAEIDRLLSTAGHPQIQRRNQDFLARIEKVSSWELAWEQCGKKFGECFLAQQPPYVVTEFEALDRDLIGYSVSSLLDRTANPQARKLVLTPLILAKLVRADRFDELETPSQIFEATLRIAIEENKLTDQGVSTDCWIDILTLIGQLFFENFWPNSSFELIAEKSSKLYRQWDDHLKNQPNNAELARVVRHFSRVEDRELLKNVLARSIFLAVNNFRLEHREWEDFLAARHLRYSVEFGFIPGLCGRGSWSRMHFLIGGMLPSGHVGEFPLSLIENVHARARDLGLGQPGKFMAQIPVGNLLGVIGHSSMALRPPTLDRLLNQYLGKPENEVPPLVELVTLNTIGFRCLRQRSDDIYRLANARCLLEHIKRSYGNPNAVQPRNLLVLTLAWILGKSLSNKLSLAWTMLMPAIDPKDSASQLYVDALCFTAHQTSQTFACNMLDETMQRVFINLLPEMLEEPAKAVSCATYLPTIVAAEIAGFAVSEVTAGLAMILGCTSEAEELAATVAEYAEEVKTPEISILWDDCRSVYLGHQHPITC